MESSETGTKIPCAVAERSCRGWGTMRMQMWMRRRLGHGSLIGVVVAADADLAPSTAKKHSIENFTCLPYFAYDGNVLSAALFVILWKSAVLCSGWLSTFSSDKPDSDAVHLPRPCTTVV